MSDPSSNTGDSPQTPKITHLEDVNIQLLTPGIKHFSTDSDRKIFAILVSENEDIDITYPTMDPEYIFTFSDGFTLRDTLFQFNATSGRHHLYRIVENEKFIGLEKSDAPIEFSGLKDACKKTISLKLVNWLDKSLLFFRDPEKYIYSKTILVM